MAQTLQILVTNNDSDLAQETAPNPSVNTIDLTVEQPNYQELVKAIFEADSIQVF